MTRCHRLDPRLLRAREVRGRLIEKQCRSGDFDAGRYRVLSMFGVLCRLAGVNGLVALRYPAGARLLRACCDRLHPVSRPVAAGRAATSSVRRPPTLP